MIGPEGAGERVRAWLEARIPARLRILETRLGLTPGSIGDPDHVAGEERGPLGIEEWPAVYVLPQTMRSLELADVDGEAGELYRATYGIRVLAWVREDGYAEVDLLRRRYVLAIREALLERRTLQLSQSVYVGNPDADLAVDPRSIRESYGDLLTDESTQQTIAGAYLDVDVTVAELLEGPAKLGTVTTADVTGTELPHPGLT